MASVSSLVQLIEQASAKAILDAPPSDDHGITESLPFPFMALVGQTEMKTALLLTLINPAVNGDHSLFTKVNAANPIGKAGRNIIRAAFFNLSNTRNFGIPESRINAAAFVNQWNTDGGNRRVQMGLRYVW